MPSDLTWTGRFPLRDDGRWLDGYPRCLQACPDGVLLGGGLGLQRLDPATLAVTAQLLSDGRVLRLSRVFGGQVYALVAGAGAGEGLATDTGHRVLRVPLDGAPAARVLDTKHALSPIAADAQGTLYISTEDDVVRRLPLEGEELEPLQIERQAGAFDRPERVKALAVSANGRWVVACFGYATWLWDQEQGGHVKLPTDADNLAVSDAGVVFVGGRSTRRFGPDGVELPKGAGVFSPDVLRLSPDGGWAVSANHWGDHVLLRLPALETARTQRDRGNTSWSGWTFEVVALTDTHLVQICDRYGWIRSWAHGEEAPCAERGGVNWGVASMSVAEGRVAWTTPSPRSLRLLEVDGGLQRMEFSSTCGPDQVSLSPDGLTALSVEAPTGFGSKRAAVLRRFDDGEVLESVTLRAESELCLFSPTGALFAVGMGGYDSSGEVLIRAPGASRAKKRLKDPKGGPLALTWREDGEALAVAWQERVQLFPLSKGGAKGSWPSCRVEALALSPAGELVISEVWDERLRRLADDRTLPLHSPCSALRFSPDGAQLFAGLADGQILVLTPALELVEVLRQHSDTITALRWSGGALWSASADGTVRRWQR